MPSRVSSTRKRWIALPAPAAPGASRLVAPATRLICPIPPARRARTRSGSSSVSLRNSSNDQTEPELGDLLVERHAREQVGDALLDRQARVPVARLGRGHQPFTAPDVRPPTSWRSAIA